MLSKITTCFSWYIFDFIGGWIFSTICCFSQFVVENRYIYCVPMYLAVNFACVKLDGNTSFTTCSHHRTSFLLCGYSLVRMDVPFYLFSLYTFYNKIICTLGWRNNRYVSLLSILDLKNILFIKIIELLNYFNC
jgi:hypothetical protein